MLHLGSTFLGDIGRKRRISSPPATPSPTHSRSPSGVIADMFTTRITASTSPTTTPARSAQDGPSETPVNSAAATTIDPVVSLELRLRWLEALLLGVKQDAKGMRGKEREKSIASKSNDTLVYLTEDVQRRLDTIVNSNDGLKRFIQHYDQHAQFLTPSFALSGLPSALPSYEDMKPDELEALLAEMEQDIHTADRDMQEIEMLESKGVTGAGKLTQYQVLKPRLLALIKAHEQDTKLAASLERRTALLMEKHATHVDALSELFVEWDETIKDAETKLAGLQREKQQRQRLGLQ